jgi:hypothetical protein
MAEVQSQLLRNQVLVLVVRLIKELAKIAG